MPSRWTGRRLFWTGYLTLAGLIGVWLYYRGYWAIRDELQGAAVALHRDDGAAWLLAVPYRLSDDLRIERQYNNMRTASAVLVSGDGRVVKVWYWYEAAEDRLRLVPDGQRPGEWTAFIDDFSTTTLHRRLVAGPPAPRH